MDMGIDAGMIAARLVQASGLRSLAERVASLEVELKETGEEY